MKKKLVKKFQKDGKMKSKIKSTSPKVSLDELFKVLSFYAEKENYDDKEIEVEDSISYFSTEINNDRGSKARKILKKFLKDGFFYAKI